jgi:amino acid transporter
MKILWFIRYSMIIGVIRIILILTWFNRDSMALNLETGIGSSDKINAAHSTAAAAGQVLIGLVLFLFTCHRLVYF